MNAADILAWTFDGAVYCLDCAVAVVQQQTRRGDEAHPVFAEYERELVDAVCDQCMAMYDSDYGGWVPTRDA